MRYIWLADGACRVDLTDTNGRIGAETRGEVNTIAGPSRDQAFRIGNARFCILHDVALDVLPIAVTKPGITLRTELDTEDTVTTEDVSPECSKSSHVLVVRGLGYLIGLEETNARRRKLDHLAQINRHKVFHLGKTHWGMLQDVDRSIVGNIGQHVAQCERMDHTAEGLRTFIERTNRTTGQTLDLISNLSQAQGRKGREAGCPELHEDAGVNSACAVSRGAYKTRKALTEAIRQFAGNILDCVVDCSC